MANKYISLENLSRFKGNADKTYILRDSELQEIIGNLSINGNLFVNGTTTTVNHENITVNSAVIITNNNGADLSTTLSGIAIKTGTDNQAYGIMFSKAEDDSVLLGLGTVAEDNSFSYSAGEGSPLAIRDDSRSMRSGYILTWDSSNNRIVSSSNSLIGLVYDSELHTSLDTKQNKFTVIGNGLVYSESEEGNTLSFAKTIEQEQLSESQVYVPTSQAVHNYVDAKFNTKVDKLTENGTTGDIRVYSAEYNGTNWIDESILANDSPTQSSVVIRTDSGTIRANNPTDNFDVVTLNHLNGVASSKVSKLTESTVGMNVGYAYYKNKNGNDTGIVIDNYPNASAIAAYGINGILKANTVESPADNDVVNVGYLTQYVSDAVGDAYTAGTNIEITDDRVINCTYEYTLPNTVVTTDTPQNIDARKYFVSKDVNTIALSVGIKGSSQWLAFTPLSICQYNSVGTAAIKLVFENVGDVSNTITIPNKTGTLSLLTDIPSYTEFSGVTYTQEEGAEISYGNNKINLPIIAGDNVTIDADESNTHLVVSATSGAAPANMVTTDTEQTITGSKNFGSGAIACTWSNIKIFYECDLIRRIIGGDSGSPTEYTYDYPAKSGRFALIDDIPSYTKFSGVVYTSEEGAEISYGNNKINLPIIAGDNVTIDADETNTHIVVSASGGSAPSNMVTTDTTQTISANKIFTNGIRISSDIGLTIFASPYYSYYRERSIKSFGIDGGSVELKFFPTGNDNHIIEVPYNSGTMALIDDIPNLDNYTGTVHIVEGTAGGGVAVHDTSNTSPYTKYGYDKIETYGNSNALQYTLNIPNKNGTIATLDDIPSADSFVTLDGTQHIVGNKFFDGSLDITQGSLYVSDIGFLPMSGGSVSFNPPPTTQEITIDLPDKNGTVALVDDLPRSITLTPTPSDDGTIYGTVGSSDLSLLQASDNNYVTLNGKLYRLSNKQSTTLSYTNTDIDSSGNLSIGTIIVTISDGAWKLYESSMASSTEISNIFEQTTTYTETYNVDSVDALPQTASAGALANVSGTYYKYEE